MRGMRIGEKFSGKRLARGRVSVIGTPAPGTRRFEAVSYHHEHA